MNPTLEIITDFRKVFLERLHGCSYDEALRAEFRVGITRVKPNKTVGCVYHTREIVSGFDNLICGKITLGRLMAALGRSQFNYCSLDTGTIYRAIGSNSSNWDKLCQWKLLREDKTECDETDQTPETLLALTNILR